MKSPANPFITTGYAGSRYFCDRKKETESLLQNIANGRSTTLIAIRRIGKTGLIKHVLQKLSRDFTGIYIDILSAEKLDDFLNILMTQIINSIPQKAGVGKRIIDFIKSLRPVVSYDPLTGQPQISIDVRAGESVKYIHSVFEYLEDYPKKVVIAIDEFQQILQFPEKNTDAWLRSSIQNLNNVVFIFSGSRQHLMNELFADPARPFYRSTSLLNIGKIAPDDYTTFIIRHFKKGGKSISGKVVIEMLEWADLHTYYVQLLCNRVYAADCNEITTETWKSEAYNLLQEQEIIFFKYRDLLTIHQWQLLKAIAREERVYSPTSKNFIAKYALGSPATVLRSLVALQKKELIYSAYDTKGHSLYKVYDLLFRRWVETQ